MPSFAGLYSPQLRLRVALGTVAVAALALSLLLAYASVTVPHSIERAQRMTTQASIAPLATPFKVATTIAGATPEQSEPANLWTLLAPWVLAVDAAAVLGFLIVMRVWRR